MADSKPVDVSKHEKNYIKFSERLREIHRTRQRNRELHWPPRFAEKLVKLILHEEVHNVYYNKKQRGGYDRYSASNREPIQYDGIFKNKPAGSQVSIVLVEGDAGIGKTTLCASISLDWAEFRRLKQFDLLLLLPLRAKEISAVRNVVELLQLFYNDEEVCKSVADSFSQGDLGKRVLIIADGWDELEESERTPGSFIYRLLFTREIICFATVMVTSRPSASVLLRKNRAIDRYIEIAGFDIKGITQYINSEFAAEEEIEHRAGLLQKIQDNPLLRSICHVPINCAIVCHMWRGDKSLPSTMTMTDMYTKIILHFVVRSLKKTFPEFNLESLDSFDAIPEEMQDGLLLMCQLAYNALVSDTFVFSYDEVKNVYPQAVTLKNQDGNQQLFTFGLMQESQAFLGIGTGASFHFIHRTFQEYLCAFHIARQTQQGQIDLMKPYAYTTRMAKAMQFVIGIGSSSATISKKVNPLSTAVVCDVFKLDSRLRIAFAGWTNDLVVHGIREAKEGEVKKYLLDLVYGDSFTFVFPRNAYDCAAVVNAVRQFPEEVNKRSQSARTVSFKLEHCGLDEELVASLAHALSGTKGHLKVKRLLIQDNNVGDKPVRDLMNTAASELQSLKQVNLAANSLGAEAISAMSTYLKKSAMESLTLSYNPLDLPGALALQNAIEMETFTNLTDLQLKDCSLTTSEAYTPIFCALPGNCTSLKQLDISENRVDKPDALGNMLGNLLLKHDTLCELYANDTNLGDEGIKALTDVLKACDAVTHINVLSIKANHIQSLGISALAKCIQSSHLCVSESLYVDCNPIHLAGTVSLASVLNTKSVSMSDCQLTACAEELKPQLMSELSKLPPSQQCQELIVDNNCFTGEHIHVLMELIRVCPELSNLSCAECDISSSDLKKVLKRTQCEGALKKLETWSLQNNKLDKIGCALLATAVRADLPKVYGVFVHGNEINNKNVYGLLEQETAKHRPKGDFIQDVVTSVLPGVRYDGIQVNIVKRHIAFEKLEDEDYDPVLLLDEYSRHGEEQRQEIEAVAGWLMSLKETPFGLDIINNQLKGFSQQSQKRATGFNQVLGNIQHPDYNRHPTREDEEERILEEERRQVQEMKGKELTFGGQLKVDQYPDADTGLKKEKSGCGSVIASNGAECQSQLKFPDLKLSGGAAVSLPSLISSLTKYFSVKPDTQESASQQPRQNLTPAAAVANHEAIFDEENEPNNQEAEDHGMMHPSSSTSVDSQRPGDNIPSGTDCKDKDFHEHRKKRASNDTDEIEVLNPRKKVKLEAHEAQ